MRSSDDDMEGGVDDIAAWERRSQCRYELASDCNCELLIPHIHMSDGTIVSRDEQEIQHILRQPERIHKED
jgi:hypothetical protein